MKKGIIDFHVHAFPDNIAAGAMKKLKEEAPEAKAYLNGTVDDLLKSMEQNGIEKSVLCSIATRPEQFEPILRWSRKIQSEKLIVFPSIHPADTEFKEHIAAIKTEGFKGVKMHPYYQDFRLDEDRLLAIYEELVKNELMLVVHTGYDIAFPYDDRADSRKIVKVTEMFPQLKFVATHLGAWQQWDESGPERRGPGPTVSPILRCAEEGKTEQHDQNHQQQTGPNCGLRHRRPSASIHDRLIDGGAEIRGDRMILTRLELRHLDAYEIWRTCFYYKFRQNLLN